MAELEWLPVKDFDPTQFPEGEFFLAWIKPSDDDGFPQLAQWDHEYDDNAEPKTEKRITGEWRHTDLYQGLDAVAFAAVPTPSEELLRLAA
jgi:hypothetical protein